MSPTGCLPVLRQTRKRANVKSVAAGHFRVPPSQATPKFVLICCHYCGHGVSDVPAGGTCPKCSGHSWERFALSRRVLPGGGQ